MKKKKQTNKNKTKQNFRLLQNYNIKIILIASKIK